MKSTFEADPYRWLFPVGILNGVVGVIPWILVGLGLQQGFPALEHSKIMILGFLANYVCGFVMTAIPRMTNTGHAKSAEVYLMVLLGALQVLTLLWGDLYSLGLVFFQIGFLLYFSWQRLKKNSTPAISGLTSGPSSLFFILWGLGSLLLSVVLQILARTLPDGVPSFVSQYGLLLMTQGFLLNMIVGLGSRLIPLLTKKHGAISPLQTHGRYYRILKAQAILLNVSFLVQAFDFKEAALILRFLILASVLGLNYKVHVKAVEHSYLGKALNMTVLFLALPYFLVLLFPEHEVHWMHFLYVGGFGILTLLISMRVLVSHGGESLQSEKTSFHIPAIFGLGVMVLMSRVLIPIFWPHFYIPAMAWVGIFWIGFLLYYSCAYLKKVVKREVRYAN